MQKLLKWLPLYLFLLTSCSNQSLVVHDEYVSYKQLASYHVQTPDPRKECPDYGQRLIVTWSLSNECLQGKEAKLFLFVRFRCRDEELYAYPINCRRGQKILSILNDEYDEMGGILTYKAEIVSEGETIASWYHQIWTDLIEFEE